MDSVIIFNPQNMWDFHLNYEIPIYHQLIDRGIKPVYIRCGLDQTECDVFWRASSGPRPPNACESCKSHTDRSLQSAMIEYESLSDYTDAADYDAVKSEIRQLSPEALNNFTFMGFRVHDQAISSVFSHLRINRFNLDDAEHVKSLREYMIYAVGALIAGAKILKTHRPKAALIFNGRMAATRAFMNLCQRHGVRVVTHERGVTRGGLHLVVNDSCLAFTHLEEISRNALEHPLKPYQVNLVSQWIKERRIGRNMSWKSFQTPGSRNLDQESANRYTEWVLFTSSMDELSSSDEFFNPTWTQYEWIEETCRIARQLGDKVRLTIRVHPNSSSAQSVGNNREEKSYFKSLKESVESPSIRVIESHESVDSYLLLDTADLVLVFASTIALESLLLSKSTYLAGPSPWLYCPGIMNFKTHPDYSAFLQKRAGKENCNLEQKRLAQGFRFAYHWLYTYQITFPFLHQVSHSFNRINVSGLDEFAQGMYPELDHVVDVILGQRELIQLPHGYFDNSSIEAETREIERSQSGTSEPLFSVIVTNYNYAGYLRNCVQSVISQNDADCEIIIVDDGSTDNSREVINELIADYPNSRIIPLLQSNSGQPAISRNNGIKIATGKFILPLDADDMIADGYLANCRKIINDRPEVNLVTAKCAHVYPDKEPQVVFPGRFVMGRLAMLNQIVIASVYSKALWQKVDGYRENVRGYEDWDMWLRMSMNGAIVAYLDGIGLIYNAKDSGLYQEAKARHEKLYAQIILNNRRAYQGNLPALKWAKNHIKTINNH